jgi:glycosyltransferase involved in cell wall biosynthesis
MNQGFLIPLYNHGKPLHSLVSALDRHKLPVIIVDDGSDAETKAFLPKILESFPRTVLVTLAKNNGKGRAMLAGFGKAGEMGLSHVLQVDADGQHDPEQAAFFLAESAKRPEAAICSFPEYDDSVPASRKSGRKFANMWSRIVSLSPDIKDSLCGFRVYPVEQSLRIMRRFPVDKRMGFDPEILVRLSWAGVPLIFFPVKVTYPKDGISHFRMFRDNVRISWVFTRLFFGMIIRLPMLLRRKL